MAAPTIYWPAKAATPENAEAWKAMAAAAEMSGAQGSGKHPETRGGFEARPATPEGYPAAGGSPAHDDDDRLADLYAEWAEADAYDRQQDNDRSGDRD